ncbi:hypothetical protein KBTX_02157 [wastewater metagenome]|uniref:glutathione transferase n=2 Tax=unclassified sequences TaxID=12908 RepID=A0A5B8RB39_9ZZZZ|nr:hypothetical protein KBTEX_02157 [uncultured organism]
MTALTVHHLAHSRSQRVLWLLEELDADYRIQCYERDPATGRAPAALRAVHPLGRSPVITDGERVVAESGAIIEYLLDGHDPDHRFRPAPGTEAFLDYRYWLHYAEGSAMPPLLLSLVFDRLGGPAAPWLMRPLLRRIAAGVRSAFVGPEVRAHLDYLEDVLQRRTWFAGEAFTAADIQMSFPVEAAVARGLAGPERPRLNAFVERIRGRAAYQRARERGGPYDLAAL